MQPPSPALSCAESIALLHLIHSVPTPPSSNAVNHLLQTQDNYTLPFLKEQDLVSTLAFLANTKVDTNHIPALCVKETSASIHVLIAVNKTSKEDGNSNLQELKRDFDRLFGILSEVSYGSSKLRNDEARLFDAIINMCSPRILCRLRFAQKGSYTLKQSFKSVFEEAIHAVQRVPTAQLGEQRQTSALFRERSKDAIKLAEAWSRHQTIARLQHLVEGIHRLSQIGNLKSLLDILPNRDMCPSSRQNLVNIVAKVSRYREAAGYLYRTAKRYQIVRCMKTVIVNLPDEAFQRTSAANRDPVLTRTIQRITGGHRQPEISHLCHLLKVTEQQLYKQFAQQTRMTLEKAKMHAEVQLIYYCDENKSGNMPRVICSCKDACFLCNAFISTHGKMYTPRHHGRLYPGWRLPTNPQSANLEKRFAAVLEKQVRDSLGTLLTRRSKTKYPDPNESTLLTLALSTSTLRTVAISEAPPQTLPTKPSCSTEAMVSVPKEQNLEPQAPSIFIEGGQRNHSPALKDSVRTQPDHEVRSQHTDSLFSPSINERNGDIQLDPVRMPTSNHNPTMLGESDAIAPKFDFHTHGPLEIHLECTSEDASVPIEPTSTDPTYEVKHLSEEESRPLLDAENATVIDVDALHVNDEQSFELLEPNVVFLRAQGVVVKIERSV
ncbi:hypothetical protein T440DRAFT_112881 [Plenodomus tracheiphilus IPT5]|uniref:Uncharacterized protein n=1 Tax=Plenodomus tracheiphilus IPT5 TaxID=1408161 RepID=A0A6A7B3F1_9PLEO|nr:hypothetical protein T440DRAFT_112881 [Plenodomus tracheiphilus IPT5]